ncbi:MAG: hypothetical protein ISN29_02035 [Gammaproteobacteria bacterium AqS3]|nr:hypothetical protein [Gammaproteobacteria bacterium AqS3]
MPKQSRAKKSECTPEAWAEHLAYRRDYYHKNREKCHAATKRWRNNNRETYLQNAREYGKQRYWSKKTEPPKTEET